VSLLCHKIKFVYILINATRKQGWTTISRRDIKQQIDYMRLHARVAQARDI